MRREINWSLVRHPTTLGVGLTCYGEDGHQFYGGSSGIHVDENTDFDSIRDTLIRQIENLRPYIEVFIQEMRRQRAVDAVGGQSDTKSLT